MNIAAAQRAVRLELALAAPRPVVTDAHHASMLAAVRAATPARRVDTDTSPASDCLFRHDLNVATTTPTREAL